MITENNSQQTNGPQVKLGPFVFADKDLLGQSHAHLCPCYKGMAELLQQHGPQSPKYVLSGPL